LVGWDIQYIRSARVSSIKPLIALALVGPRLDDEFLEDFRDELYPHEFNHCRGRIQFSSFDLTIDPLFLGPGIHNMREPASLLQPDYFVRPNNVRTLVTYSGQSPSLVDAIFVDEWMLLITDDERKLDFLFVADSDRSLDF
jgi:hypothetical protein